MCMLDEIHAKRDEIYAIARKHKAEKLWVFGSCARKEERPDSDIDLLVLLSGEKKSIDREMEICGQMMLLEIQTGIYVSPKVYLKKDWENRPFVTPFYLNVMREGIVL